MNHYENLGTLAVRWMAVGFLVLAAVSLVLAGTMGMGSMMVTAEGEISGHMADMGGGAWMWWGATGIPLIIGIALYAASRPIGRAMASGLVDPRLEGVEALLPRT